MNNLVVKSSKKNYMETTMSNEKPVLSLGEHYVSDFLNADEHSTDRKKYSLDLWLDKKIGAVRLGQVAPPEAMWGRYWYRSGTNATMTRELGKIVTEVTERVKTKPGDVWLDIACNDGTLLRQVPDTFTKVGIDPCDDTFHAESSKHATVIQDYFSKAAYDKATDKKAKVITCVAMFYDLDDPNPFIEDLHAVLDDNGVLVLQMSYTPLMLSQMAFDNICHEHVYYYSLGSLAYLFQQHGFAVIDADLNDVNGGSMRVYLVKQGCDPKVFGSEQLRQVCMYRTDAILTMETRADIADSDVWGNFGMRINKLKTDVYDFMNTAREAGKTVYGYGASTKGNTLLQLFNLTTKDIVAIAERSPYKFGKKTIGSEIPIISEDEMRAARPDYLFVLPWHFIDEFIERERQFLLDGGALVVPCPEFKIITKADLV